MRPKKQKKIETSCMINCERWRKCGKKNTNRFNQQFTGCGTNFISRFTTKKKKKKKKGFN